MHYNNWYHDKMRVTISNAIIRHTSLDKTGFLLATIEEENSPNIAVTSFMGFILSELFVKAHHEL